MYRSDRYHPNFFKFQRQKCLEDAGFRCVRCGLAQKQRYHNFKTGKSVVAYLHAHHPNRDPENPDPLLICLCAFCHGKEERYQKQRVMQLSAGQLFLPGIA